ncbi:hypothetical protein AHF37_07413 [Paragonimus kellicotti]|nr:hypothetical protein AHF37_07413 [Paragonimus kellicotti]
MCISPAFVTLPLADLPSTSEYQQWLPMQSPQSTPFLTNLENWHSTGLSRCGDTSMNPRASNNSPSVTRFRKRSTPVGCFRHSTSTSVFACPNESANEAAPETGGKKKRSWTAGIVTTADTSSTHRFGVTSPNSAAVSTDVSPSYQSSRASLTLSETSLPQIRLNVQYESIDILPLDYYGELRETAEEHRFVSSSFTYRRSFLHPLCSSTLRKSNQAMILRSNSIASKSVECYIKLVGSGKTKKGYKFYSLITKSCRSFSDSELREAFCALNSLLEKTYGSRMALQVISSCLFLRFICPAIHGPVLFGLTNSVPENSRISRNLTLLAKVLQNLANMSKFEEKEMHMKVLNMFVEREIPVMQAFLRNVASLDEAFEEDAEYEDCHNFIDLGYEYAKLSSLLLEYLRDLQVNNELREAFCALNSLLEKTYGSRMALQVISTLFFDSSGIHGPFVRTNNSYGKQSHLPKFDTSGKKKEMHMKVLNMFVEREIPVMQAFLRNVASLDEAFEKMQIEDCHNFIDLGYEYAKLSSLLLEYLRDLQVNKWTSPGQKVSDDAFERSNYDRISVTGASQYIEHTIQREQDDRNECNYQPPERSDPVRSHWTPNPLNTHQIEETGLFTNANMDELVVHYEEQMRELNACIDRVENISLESGTSAERGRKQPFLNGSVQPEDISSLSGCSSHNGKWRTDPAPGLVNYLQSEVGYKQDISDYEFNDEEQRSDMQNQQCQSEPLEIRLNGTRRIDEVPPNHSVLSESPSLDQLAERLQELKRLLKRERQELAQVVATKARVIQAQEQSIEQLSCELNQLRKTPATRQRAPCELPSNKHTSGTNSPSSSLSSECFVSNRSDETTPQLSNEMRFTGETSGFVHRKSESCGQQRVSPYVNNQRSHSFRSNPDQNGPDNPQVRYGPNLLDLSRASEGTGIPLGALITPNNPVPVRRRFSETKTIYH